jgi:outer membrane lipoprotein-sorting protein
MGLCKTAVKPCLGVPFTLYLMLPLMLCIAIAWGVSAAPDDNRPGREITGPEKEKFLQTWRQHLQNMDSLHMVFTQEKHLRVLQRPIVSQGELWLQGETLLYQLSNTAGAVELVMRLDDKAVQMYYPLLQRLEVLERQTVPLSSTPVPFMGRDMMALTQAYDSALFESAGRYTLTLTPKASDSQALFSAIRLQIEAFHIRRMTQVEKNGDRVVMTISAFEPNAVISEAQLALQVPPETQVVNPLRP